MTKGHKISLGGLDLLPDLSGAVYVPELKMLVIADLHLEQGSSLARRGLYVPPFDTAVTLAVLIRLMDEHKPEQLVLLGDSFHDGEGSSRLQAHHHQALHEITLRAKIFWVSGNHDPVPPQKLNGAFVDALHLGSLVLRHEPSPLEHGQHEVSGHLHPGCTIVQRGRALRGKCFVSDGQRLILPAFGAYTGALGLSHPAYDGLINPETAKVWMIGRSSLQCFPLARLG